MGCKTSKNLVQVHNTGFDLMDADGDHKVSKEEVEMVATYFHRFAIMQSEARHSALVNTPPIDYLYKVVDKRLVQNLKDVILIHLLTLFHQKDGKQNFYLL